MYAIASDKACAELHRGIGSGRVTYHGATHALCTNGVPEEEGVRRPLATKPRRRYESGEYRDDNESVMIYAYMGSRERRGESGGQNETI